MQDYDIAFVCDGNRFETPSALLMASLRMTGETADLIAYVPTPRLEDLSDGFKDLCGSLNCRIMGFDATANWRESYPIGNKIIALSQRRDTLRTLFLDTDVVAYGRLDLPEPIGQGHFLAAMQSENPPSFGKALDWQKLYGLFDLKVPPFQSHCTRGVIQYFPPYFNAGVLLLSNTVGDSGRTFADIWLDTALTIDHAGLEVPTRPWLDQLTLPVAVARARAELCLLPESLNYSSYRRRTERVPAHIRLYHYHQLAMLARKPKTEDILRVIRDKAGAGLANRYAKELEDTKHGYIRDTRHWRPREKPVSNNPNASRFVASTAPVGAPQITHFQVFGERCSGTHYVEELMRTNLGPEPTVAYGWAHGFPTAPLIADSALAVVVVRDPVSWLEEVHNRPFELSRPFLNMPISTFLRSEWTASANNATGRWSKFANADDHVPTHGRLQYDLNPSTGLPFANPMRLRTAKLRGQFTYLNRAQHAVICRYEDVRDDPEGFLDAMSNHFAVPRRHVFTPADPSHDTIAGPRQKHQDTTLSEEDRAFVLSELDLTLERRLGYLPETA